ncbi:MULTISPECIES: hypothetical protein [Bacillus]|jgi:hypothetical protein|uniref:hypothetical protein n=1 Tax=Bacillus TaxID=1386 RepID=UPI0002059AB9|nr:hypothetical protein [Bacillus amyloliquefaciens]AIW34826.1 hypothetical protein KS08_14640 [Bacillus subtilis]AEB25141.1 hypothetical protein BAMTA208_14910 [Bacillus amyloliquefaciens TA208]AEB64655.1 hypothetical protein LL3_03124 [Bacillus amyloliquefaciens LL3]AEK90179.1 hypothetical protein BAXH7_03057 [Bacillus amyloliquefaciens XH7]ARW40154.1 hypothetical protein S101267_03070 [Bacillus amyloliquefaciens]
MKNKRSVKQDVPLIIAASVLASSLFVILASSVFSGRTFKEIEQLVKERREVNDSNRSEKLNPDL